MSNSHTVKKASPLIPASLLICFSAMISVGAQEKLKQEPERIGTLSGPSTPARTVEQLLPATTKEVLDLLRFIRAEQESAAIQMEAYDYDATEERHIKKAEINISLNRLVKVQRSKDTLLVLDEQSDAPRAIPGGTPDEIGLVNSGKPLVSKALLLQGRAIVWADVLKPILNVQEKEDWQAPHESYDARLLKMTAVVEPAKLSTGVSSNSTFKDITEHVLSQGDENWRWEVHSQPDGIFQVKEMSRLTPDFCDLTITVDATLGCVITEAIWSPRGPIGPKKLARNTYTNNGEATLLSEHIEQEFDASGTVVDTTRTTYRNYTLADMGRNFTIESLQPPDQAVFMRIQPDREAKSGIYKFEHGKLIAIE